MVRTTLIADWLSRSGRPVVPGEWDRGRAARGGRAGRGGAAASGPGGVGRRGTPVPMAQARSCRIHARTARGGIGRPRAGVSDPRRLGFPRWRPGAAFCRPIWRLTCALPGDSARSSGRHVSSRRSGVNLERSAGPGFCGACRPRGRKEIGRATGRPLPAPPHTRARSGTSGRGRRRRGGRRRGWPSGLAPRQRSSPPRGRGGAWNCRGPRPAERR